MKIFTFLVTLGGICLFFGCGASAVETDRVSVFVMEGDAVTLYTDVEINQKDRMIWFFEDNRIALINGDQSKICTDDQCKERFRDRLIVNQTGSLTIMNTRTTDSGLYKLKITSRNIEKIFSVTVHGVSSAERDEMRKSVKMEESVTLDSRVIKNPNDMMTWYFNDTIIVKITGDQSVICTDDQCEERFRDRLELDLQTGALTITDTRTTDSGLYQLQINRIKFSIIRIFTVTVTYSGSSSVAAVVVVVLLLLLVVAAAAVFYKCKSIMKCIRRQPRDRMNGAKDPPLEQTDALMPMVLNETSHNKTEAANET